MISKKRTHACALVSAVLAFSSLALAATTGSVTIQGNVAKAVSIQVTGVGTFNNLDLTQNATDLQVASVVEKSNVQAGYTVTLASSNAGLLKNGALGSLAYTAKYNGTSVTLSATPQTVTNAGTSTVLVNATKPMTVSYAGQNAETLMSGTYSDTLTFTIAAK